MRLRGRGRVQGAAAPPAAEGRRRPAGWRTSQVAARTNCAGRTAQSAVTRPRPTDPDRGPPRLGRHQARACAEQPRRGGLRLLCGLAASGGAGRSVQGTRGPLRLPSRVHLRTRRPPS